MNKRYYYCPQMKIYDTIGYKWTPNLMFMNNPNLGKAVNIGLEQSALSDEEKFLQRATQRREGIESAIKSVPSKFQSFIERNRGPADESFTSYFDGGIVSALKGVK